MGEAHTRRPALLAGIRAGGASQAAFPGCRAPFEDRVWPSGRVACVRVLMTRAAYRCGGSSGWALAVLPRPSRFPFTPRADEAPRRHQRGKVYHPSIIRQSSANHSPFTCRRGDRLDLVNRCPAFARWPGQTGSRCAWVESRPVQFRRCPRNGWRGADGIAATGCSNPGRRHLFPSAHCSFAGHRHSQARIPAWCIGADIAAGDAGRMTARRAAFWHPTDPHSPASRFARGSAGSCWRPYGVCGWSAGCPFLLLIPPRFP